MESLIYLLKSTAILSLFILVYEIFLRKETLYKQNRVFLLLGIFTAGILPYFSIQKTIQITQYVASTNNPTSVEFISTSSEFLATVPEKISFWESLNYLQILFAIYLLVVVFFLVKFLFSLWKLKSFLKNEKNCTLKHGIKYIQTKENTGPFSFLKYIVYNPNLHNDSELKLILKHEEAHVKNYHSADMLLANILVFTNWFNPLAWLYRKRISQNLEFLADQEATQNLNCPKAYQLSLLNYVQIDSSHLPVNNFHKSFINTRIKKLHQLKSNKYASLKIGFILPLLTAFFLVFQVNSQEEIEYIEVDAIPLISENEGSSENQTIYLEENQEDLNEEISENKSVLLTESNSKKQSDTTIISKTSIKVSILKTTTEASLKEIKKFLENKERKFNYSSLKYDKNNKLTQINISFKDKNGKDYHYSILGDKPIPEVQLVISDDFTGFKTFTNSDKTQSIDRSSAVILNGKPSSDLESELKEILVAANKRSEKDQKNTLEIVENQLNSASYIKSINIIKNTATGRDGTGFIIINDEKITDSIRLIHEKDIRFINNQADSITLVHKNNNQSNEQTKKNASYDVRIFMMDKNTSNQEFEKVKTYFASHNIDFTSSIKRNKKGEITKVKIKSSDQNGKISTTSYENNQGISSFQLGLKGSDFFIKS